MATLPPHESLYTFSSDKANPTFMLYTSDDYSKVFDVAPYFNPTIDVVFTLQSSVQVKTLAIPYSNKLVTIDPVSMLENSTANNSDVFITLSHSTTETTREQDVVKVCKYLTSHIMNDFSADVEQDDTGTSRIKDSITYDHAMMRQYADDINQSLAMYYFNVVQNIIAQKFATTKGSQQNTPYPCDNFVKACINFGKMWDTQSRYVFSVLVKGVGTFFDDFFAKQTAVKLSSSDLQQFITSLGSGYNSSFYFSLRQSLVDTLTASASSCQNPVKDTEGQDVSMYMYKIIADVFIKCSFPLIQYTFIDRMMSVYMTQGDFFNTRVGLLAKVFFTCNIVSILSIAIQMILSTPASVLATIQVGLGDIITKFSMYIQNMNNIDMTEGTTATTQKELNAIQNQLYALSRSVQQTSGTNLTLQNEVQSLRLLIRNIDYNTNIQRQKHTNIKIEFSVVIAVLVFVILTCSTLLVLQNVMKGEDDKLIKIVYYVAGGTFVLVLLYKLVLFMFSIMNKN
jgi:hypothetical protein